MGKYNLLKDKEKASSTEVLPAPKKKTYSLAYKKKILSKARECKAPGELAALLRREGLSSSTVHGWRVAEANGELRASRALSRGPRKALSDKQSKKLKELERENYRLKKRLERAEALIDLQKKIAAIMSEDSVKKEESK